MKARNRRNDRLRLRRNPAFPSLFALALGTGTSKERPTALLSSGRHGAGHLSLSLLESYQDQPGYNQGMKKPAAIVRRSDPPSGEVVRIPSSAAFIYDDFSCCGFHLIYDYDCVRFSGCIPAPSRDSRSYCHTWTDPLEAGGQSYYRVRWYLPEGGVFGERDPRRYHESCNLFQVVEFDSVNRLDPTGLASLTLAEKRRIKKDTLSVFSTLQEGLLFARKIVAKNPVLGPFLTKYLPPTWSKIGGRRTGPYGSDIPKPPEVSR